MDDYYSILGVDRGATQDEIKRAYRTLALQHHPDRNGGDPGRMQEINVAYGVLNDPAKRSAYDTGRKNDVDPEILAKCKEFAQLPETVLEFIMKDRSRGSKDRMAAGATVGFRCPERKVTRFLFNPFPEDSLGGLRAGLIARLNDSAHFQEDALRILATGGFGSKDFTGGDELRKAAGMRLIREADGDISRLFLLMTDLFHDDVKTASYYALSAILTSEENLDQNTLIGMARRNDQQKSRMIAEIRDLAGARAVRQAENIDVIFMIIRSSDISNGAIIEARERIGKMLDGPMDAETLRRIAVGQEPAYGSRFGDLFRNLGHGITEKAAMKFIDVADERAINEFINSIKNHGADVPVHIIMHAKNRIYRMQQGQIASDAKKSPFLPYGYATPGPKRQLR
ncbi:MAG: J domain-containing protein [Candidatus Bilamarchaeaceae archaeon]